MNRQYIINEIKRTARKNDGVPLRMAIFHKKTGIKKKDWCGKYWTNWCDAVKEAGYRLGQPLRNECIGPLQDPRTAFGKLNEQQYKAELELVDRYQSFVAEILRLSLAGIAVFGFLLKNVFKLNEKSEFLTIIGIAKTLAGIAVLMFCISAVCALIFRFFAAEGARFYIEALRFRPENLNLSQQSLDVRYRKIRVCRWSKATAAISLALGGVFIATALLLLLIKSFK